MSRCRCARCRGRLIKDRMFDLPRKIHEFFCLNCGERFWMEVQSASITESENSKREMRAPRLGIGPGPWLGSPALAPAPN